MKKKLIAGLVASAFVHGAWAIEKFKISDIRVEGIQRTEAGTVFSYLPVKVGDTLDDEKSTQAIRALFATGFFKDVRLEREGSVLVVVVDERPAIAALTFSGLKAFKEEDLTKGLKDVGLAVSRIFDRALVDRAEQELKRQYIAQGYYAVDVQTTITPLERNRVSVSFAVVEGEIAKIKQISVVGNKVFKEGDLLDTFALRTTGWFSWYTGDDKYSKQKLSADLETLRSYYLDRGYLEFNVDSTQVQISKDKQDIYITINVAEGEQFKVGSVKLAGDLVLPDAELKPLVRIRPGDTFSRERLTETTKAISDRLANEGYAFANVNASPELDREKLSADFTIYVDPGRRTYVRRINVVGNTKTRDEVIRREVRQMESAWYDGDRINKSKQRVDKLGYFEEVNVETPPVPGTTDQVDVEVKVKEKATGSLTIGAGYSSADKLVFSASVQQQNVFGSGNYLAFQFSNSSANQIYSLSHTDPYFTPDGISRGFDVYMRKTDTSRLLVGNYAADAVGGGVRFGVPIAEDDAVFLGLSADQTVLKVGAYSPKRYIDYVTSLSGCGIVLTSDRCEADSKTWMTSLGWQRDGRDSFIYPTRGTYQRLSLEAALPGSTATYYRATYQYQQFFPLNQFFSLGKRWVLMLNGEFGYADAYGDKELPFFKNFYAGGIGSVRGFESGTLGPRDATTKDPLGGNQRFVGNAEVFMPLPGSGLDKSVRFSAFLDAGNVWGYDEKFSASDLRLSTGIALSWSSPVGPLKFSFAKPLNDKPGDKTQAFQFQLGATF